MHKIPKFLLMYLIVLYCFSTGCGGSGSTSESMADNYYTDSSYSGSYTDSNYNEYESNLDTNDLPVTKQDKLIYTADIYIETKNYTNTYTSIKSLITSYDGIIQHESVSDNDYGWYEENSVPTASMRAEFTCRIPSDKYKDFINEFSGLDNDNKITHLSSTAKNINQEYYDTKNKEQALQIQYDRLLEMLSQSQNVSEMLQIEERLSDVDYQLNSIRNKLLTMDTDVAYSTVQITIEEVTLWSRDKEDSFFTKLGNIFKETIDYGKELLESLIYTLLMFIPTLLFIIMPGLLILKLLLAIIQKVFKFDIKKIIKRKSKKDSAS